MIQGLRNTLTLALALLSISAFGMQVDTDSVFIIGSAAPGGWDLEAQTLMEQSEADTNVFVYSDTLVVGEFKLKLYTANDWCAGEWLHPLEASQDLSLTDAVILTGCADDNPDYKWEITEAGIYTVTANLTDTTVTIALEGSYEVTYDSLFLIGDATPGGWDLTSQTPMIQDSTNVNIFTWNGTLTAGEIKIKTYAESDFCAGEWIHPIEASASLSSTEIAILVGCSDTNPDYKWVVTDVDTGEYDITVNLDSLTIDFEKKSSTAIDEEDFEISEYELHQNYPNPFNPSTVISFQLPANSLTSLKVYDMLGREVATLINGTLAAGSYTATFDASALSSGVYIYVLQTPAISLTRKMLLVK